MSEALKGLAPEMVNYTDEEGFQAAGGWFPNEGIAEYVRADLLAALQAENERLRWEAKCLGETLDAWFDRRKLGHDAVDQAVVDAASGYLRTSRVGGMSNEESDMILDVIQDMARLGLFADLFARAALKGDAP